MHVGDRHRRVTRAPSLSALLALVACGGDAAPVSEGVEVIDRAGVRIVVNADPSLASVPALAISPDPIAEIGATSGPDHELFGVRGGVLLSDGTVAVVNGSTREIRYFDEAGRHVRTVGGEGQGPGEYGGGVHIVGAFGGDSILVFEQLGSRASVLDPQGRFARLHHLPLDVPIVSGVLEDGSTVARSFRWPSADSARVASPLILFTAAGRVRDTLEVVLGPERIPFVQGVRTYAPDVMFGRAENVWLQEYPMSSDTLQVWRQYGRDGVLAARLELPADLEILDFAADRVLVLARNELGVEIVRILGIVKQP